MRQKHLKEQKDIAFQENLTGELRPSDSSAIFPHTEIDFLL